MSKRTERRAAEREAHKLAYQQLRQQRAAAPVDEPASEPNISDADLLARAQAFFETEPVEAQTVSEAQLSANRENSKLSTGPITLEGNAVSSRNALKTGLTGHTVLLATDDAGQYDRQLNAAIARFKPATEEEHNLVQSIVDSRWRLTRIQRIENGILLKGQIEFANKFEDQPLTYRAQLIEVETYLKYEKSIRNLHIQEARLHRRIDKVIVELTRLQALRKRDEAVSPKQSPSVAFNHAAPNGFEFSTSEPHRPSTQRVNANPNSQAA